MTAFALLLLTLVIVLATRRLSDIGERIIDALTEHGTRLDP